MKGLSILHRLLATPTISPTSSIPTRRRQH